VVTEWPRERNFSTTCEPTPAARRRTEGLSSLEILRCLKRYIAHEIHHALVSFDEGVEVFQG
jgi:hypothetical protein